MAAAEKVQEGEASAEAPKKKGKVIGVMAMVLVLLSLGGAGGWFFMREATKESVAVEAAKPPELYMPLEPAFVVNFQDQDAARFLQVGVTVMAHDQATLDAVKQSDPVIRNALVMLFSSQSYAVLSSPAGKLKLQEQALDAVRKIVAQKPGRLGVQALYFTSFVMQ